MKFIYTRDAVTHEPIWIDPRAVIIIQRSPSNNALVSVSNGVTYEVVMDSSAVARMVEEQT